MIDKGTLILFERYIRQKVSPGTVRVYMYALRSFFSQLNGNEPSKEAAQRYLDSLAKLSPNTIGLRAHAIMRYFKWMEQPIELDHPTIRVGEPKYLNMNQVEELLAACNTPLEDCLVAVLFDTAVRISELLNLEKGDINWEDGFISVIRKGGRREEVNISKRGLEALDRWLDARESTSRRVFADLEYNDALITVKRVGKRIGIDVHPHMLRHSRAIQLLINGAPLYVVQQHLGHASIATTANIYGRFRAVDLKEQLIPW